MAVAKNTLRILTLERLGETFNQQSCPLRYTPRKFVIHPEHKVCPLHAIHMAAMAAAACPCHRSAMSWLLIASSCSKLCACRVTILLRMLSAHQLQMLLLTVVMLSVCLMGVDLYNCLSDMYGMG